MDPVKSSKEARTAPFQAYAITLSISINPSAPKNDSERLWKTISGPSSGSDPYVQIGSGPGGVRQQRRIREDAEHLASPQHGIACPSALQFVTNPPPSSLSLFARAKRNMINID